MQFPNEVGLPRSADGSEAILGGSIGLNKILLLLKERSMHDKTLSWSLYLLNAFSIFRNVYVSDLSNTQLRDAFLKDCELFTTYLEAYISHLSNRVVASVPLVVYFPDYGRIPPDIRRERTAKALDMESRYQILAKSFPHSPTSTSQGECTTRWIVPVGRQMLPHLELARWIQGYAMESHKSAYRWGQEVFLFTHCPIDLHMHKRVPNLFLIESYTAAIKSPLQFGTKFDTKLVPEAQIPFNVATHRALGDSVHIAPIATGKTRKALLEAAVANKWMRQSQDKIASDISYITKTPIAELNRIKF